MEELIQKTEERKRQSAFLKQWIQNSPENFELALQRILYMSLYHFVNDGTFIESLHDQNVIEQPSQLELIKPQSNFLTQVQLSIGTCFRKRCFQELVVALEQSDNAMILTQLCESAEAKSFKQDLKNMAPTRVQRSLSSLFSMGSATAAALKQSNRYIDVDTKENPVTALGVCNKNIFIGFSSGQINIYNSTDLQSVAAVFRYCKNRATVTLLQCTCTEILAAYSDGALCSWNIESGQMLEILAENSKQSNNLALCMRWRKPYLVVGKINGIIGIIQQGSNGLFTCRGIWDSNVKDVTHVDLYSDYVIVKGNGCEWDNDVVMTPAGLMKRATPWSRFNVNILHFNGNPVRTIAENWQTQNIIVHNGHLIGTGGDKVLRIWDLKTGQLLKQLMGHSSRIQCMDAQSDIIISGDQQGEIIIWSLEAALKGETAVVLRVNDPEVSQRSKGSRATTPAVDGRIFFGHDWILTWNGEVAKVTDFSQ